MSGEPEPVLPEETVPSPEEAATSLLEEPQGAGAETVTEESAAPVDLDIDLPDDPVAAVDILLRELAESRREAREHLDRLQRVAADFENYRKRVERDRREVVERASQRMIEHLLPSLDSFDAALAYETGTPTEEKILEGMRGTHTQLLETLAREGLEPVPGVGHAFDPAVHEAVSGPSEPGDGELVVAQELRRGYVLRGRVIRPALVAVEHRERE